jgi:hypothetical protein
VGHLRWGERGSCGWSCRRGRGAWDLGGVGRGNQDDMDHPGGLGCFGRHVSCSAFGCAATDPSDMLLCLLLYMCRWSLGVLAFELVAGVPPFMHEDRMVMYRRIVDGVYTCPAHFSAVRDAVKHQTHEHRLCHHGSLFMTATTCPEHAFGISRLFRRLKPVFNRGCAHMCVLNVGLAYLQVVACCTPACCTPASSCMGL